MRTSTLEEISDIIKNKKNISLEDCEDCFDKFFAAIPNVGGITTIFGNGSCDNKLVNEINAALLANPYLLDIINNANNEQVDDVKIDVSNVQVANKNRVRNVVKQVIYEMIHR